MSRLNEIGGGKENTVFSFWIMAENFEVFENDLFDCKVLWMVGEGEWISIGFCSSVTFVVRSQSISWSR